MLFVGCGEVVTSDAEPTGGSSAVSAGTGGKTSSAGQSNGGQSAGGKGSSVPTAGEAPDAMGGYGGGPEPATDPSAGAAGQGNEPPLVYPDDEELLGSYDVTFDQPPVIDGCTPLVTISRLNLHVFMDASNEVFTVPFRDFDWSYDIAEDGAWSYDDDGWLTVDAIQDGSGNELTPALRFEVDRNGFTGVGRSSLPYSCNGEVVFKGLDITIGPDVTAPRIRLDPLFAGRDVFPFSFFTFSFSEPLSRVSGTAGHDFAFRSEEEVAASVALWDVSGEMALATTATPWLFGPAYGLVFDDFDAVRGHEIELEVTEPWVDFAGNVAVALEETFLVHETGPAVSSLDFDAGSHVGAHGSTTYYAPGTQGAPCESGGCLALTGTLTECSDSLPKPSLLALRLTSADAAKFRVRFRIWSSSSAAPALLAYEAPGCEIAFGGSLQPLAQPDGAFDHASAWITHDFSCLGPSPDKGIVLSFGCSESFIPEDAPVEARLVIESVTPVQ